MWWCNMSRLFTSDQWKMLILLTQEVCIYLTENRWIYFPLPFNYNRWLWMWQIDPLLIVCDEKQCLCFVMWVNRIGGLIYFFSCTRLLMWWYYYLSLVLSISMFQCHIFVLCVWVEASDKALGFFFCLWSKVKSSTAKCRHISTNTLFDPPDVGHLSPRELSNPSRSRQRWAQNSRHAVASTQPPSWPPNNRWL